MYTERLATDWRQHSLDHVHAKCQFQGQYVIFHLMDGYDLAWACV